MKFKKISVNKPPVLGLVLAISSAENEENLSVVSGSVALEERRTQLPAVTWFLACYTVQNHPCSFSDMARFFSGPQFYFLLQK